MWTINQSYHQCHWKNFYEKNLIMTLQIYYSFKKNTCIWKVRSCLFSFVLFSPIFFSLSSKLQLFKFHYLRRTQLGPLFQFYPTQKGRIWIRNLQKYMTMSKELHRILYEGTINWYHWKDCFLLPTRFNEC